LDSYIERANQLIEEATSAFLKQVYTISENGPFRKARKVPSTFSMFHLANDEFYESAYFERMLEWYTRDLLINPILHGLLKIHSVKTLWPEDKQYVRYSTEALENVLPFEFVIWTDNQYLGVRYTGLDTDEVDGLLNEYKLARIIRIRWDDKKCAVGNEKYSEMTPEEFFSHFLSKEEFDLFITAIHTAVKAAKDDIGFDTIPKLSLRYLSSFKVDLAEILRTLPYSEMRFQMLPGSKDYGLDQLRLETEDYRILDERFVCEERYKALLGTEGFAKCFITAEYQYQVFKQGHHVDYTSVACGYLKAVEQLIHKLLQINLNHTSGETLWIKRNGLSIPSSNYHPGITCRSNPITRKPQVIFAKGFELYFDITLTPMVWFLHDNGNGWHTSDKARLITHRFLVNYANECRNDHLHKDNIDVFDVVSRIRNNTLLIFYLLLGGYRLTGSTNDDHEALGIVDDTFDRLYKKVQVLPKGIAKFIIKLSNKESVKAYRHFDQDPTVYAPDGSVAASSIRFVIVEHFSSEEYDKAMNGEYADNEFLLTEKTLPESISYINARGEEITIDW